jgi:hypothetical protein
LNAGLFSSVAAGVFFQQKRHNRPGSQSGAAGLKESHESEEHFDKQVELGVEILRTLWRVVVASCGRRTDLLHELWTGDGRAAASFL